jgi:HlyD family secretion protein
MLKKIVIVVIIILALVLAYLAWSLLNVKRVSYITLQFGEAIETLLVSGRVVGEGAVPLSFKLSGQLSALVVLEGDLVFKGEEIARLDDQEVLNLVTQSENNLNSAEIAVSRLQNRDLPQAEEALRQAEIRAEIAESLYRDAADNRLAEAIEIFAEAEREESDRRRLYEDARKSYQEGNIDLDTLNRITEEWESSLDSLDAATTAKDNLESEVANLARELEIARSQERSAESTLNSLKNEELQEARLKVDQARTQLEQARLELEQTVMKAPFPGVISQISVGTGQHVSPGQEVCIIIPESANTIVEAQVDEEFAGKIVAGQEVVIRSAAFPDTLFTGNVERVSPTIDPARGTFQVRFILDRFAGELLPDLAVTAEIVTDRFGESLLVEQSLTFQENGALFVFVEESGYAGKREITTDDLGRGFLLVKEGLSAGDKVLADLDLEEGQRIRLGEERKND